MAYSTKKGRVYIQSILRSLHLLAFVEKIRYHYKVWTLKERNKKFISQNPGFKLPPLDLAFDAYSAPDWDFYKESGEKTARFLAELAKEYCVVDNSFSVYEWGCGPGRVIRHIPNEFGHSVAVHGSDYNKDTIDWCSANIPSVNFTLNNLTPPLPYDDNSFDFIYCISVFTHLAEDTGIEWARELRRVLKPNGLLLITTLGASLYEKELLKDERKVYDEIGIVVRGEYEEGKKMFLAIHNPKYVRHKLLRDFKILKHEPTGFPFVNQEYWLVRKES